MKTKRRIIFWCLMAVVLAILYGPIIVGSQILNPQKAVVWDQNTEEDLAGYYLWWVPPSSGFNWDTERTLSTTINAIVAAGGGYYNAGLSTSVPLANRRKARCHG